MVVSGFSVIGMCVMQEVYSGFDVPVDSIIVGVNFTRCDWTKVDAALLDLVGNHVLPSPNVSESLPG